MRFRLRKIWANVACRILLKCVIVFGVFFLLCEYAVYPFVIWGCSWPNAKLNGVGEDETLRAMFLADTHLLGPFRGHWFDKLRREWQMHRSFQTAMYFFEPDVVFFLGDVFDEGNRVNEEGFKEYVDRFNSLFSVEETGKTQSFVLTGNHDMGFHYQIKPYLHGRFNRGFNTTSVRLITLKGSKFLMINSMAMHMDSCFLCSAAMDSLKRVSASLQCEEDPTKCSDKQRAMAAHDIYSPPIVLQHFPLYRPSDADCTGEDVAPEDEKNNRFREKYDCLSKESSQFLLESIKPRLILSGHTHHHCIAEHPSKIPSQKSVFEYSIPSFSWRNRNDPSFYLAVITPQQHHLLKCYLPQETTVIKLYFFGCLVLAWIIFPDLKIIFSKLCSWRVPELSKEEKLI